ncbi:MAG: DNA-3-methyladenine glycosylase [Firmicutes bacterium ADurb.Bin193]|nr:MAG: DNA-3-methyladenine glycosylase [Firmicutes bacterium ADurb.Bin193]
MLLKNTKDFDLKQTFECGQCFRWNPDSEGYTGVVGDYIIHAKQSGSTIEIDGADDEFIIEYFDLDRNYEKVKSKISNDDIIKKAVLYGGGIRILRQDPWEALVSFIISANNNIPRIKRIIESLCRTFGKPLTKGGKEYYSFPTAEVLSHLKACDLSPLRCGYRDGYIIDAAQRVATGALDLFAIYNMDEDEGRRMLKTVKGVGDKVADCVLLFAYGKYGVFPRDVWIKRMMNRLYSVDEKEVDAFARQKFGKLGGFAQQYLFFYGRSG